MPSASTLRAELWVHRMRTWVVMDATDSRVRRAESRRRPCRSGWAHAAATYRPATEPGPAMGASAARTPGLDRDADRLATGRRAAAGSGLLRSWFGDGSGGAAGGIRR